MSKKKPKTREATGADKRAHPRVALEVLVQVKSDTIAEFRQVHAKNLSVGGMFIAAPSSAEASAKPLRALGTQIYFQFTVKDGGTLIEGLGKIVHASAAGLGVEFVSVLEPSASIIRALVDERLNATVPAAG